MLPVLLVRLLLNKVRGGGGGGRDMVLESDWMRGGSGLAFLRLPFLTQ
eukprot:COSAG02_NODE_22194_length_760_cov_1.465961_2_plen_47_part_01